MFSVLWDPPGNKTPFTTDPTPYEVHLQRQRDAVELRKQVQQFGGEARRVDPRLPLDAVMPMEDFERAYQLRMPDQKPGKEKDTDPCRSLLLKALCIQKSTGKKSSRAPKTVAENGDARGHPNTRHPGLSVLGESTEAGSRVA